MSTSSLGLGCLGGQTLSVIRRGPGFCLTVLGAGVEVSGRVPAAVAAALGGFAGVGMEVSGAPAGEGVSADGAAGSAVVCPCQDFATMY